VIDQQDQEESINATGGEPPDAPEDLKSQADSVRRSRSAAARELPDEIPSPVRIVLYLIVISVILMTAVFLLAAQDRRLQLVELAVGAWLPASDGAEVFRLPPPPPPTPARMTVTAPIGSGSTLPQAPPGVLFLDEFPEAGDLVSESEGDEPAESEPVLSRNEENTLAWEFLQKNAELVSALLTGEVPDLQFLSWSPVKDDPPEFWIDLTALWQSESQEVHLIWAVNLETERITPLSQAARDLEFSR